MSVMKAWATWVAGRIKTRAVLTESRDNVGDHERFNAWCPSCDWSCEKVGLARVGLTCPRCFSRLVEDRCDD